MTGKTSGDSTRRVSRNIFAIFSRIQDSFTTQGHRHIRFSTGALDAEQPALGPLPERFAIVSLSAAETETALARWSGVAE
jgi:hypothetical protein